MISVEPSGMPVWETPEPGPTPSGDVELIVGVGMAIPLTCAQASFQTTNTASIAVINVNFIGVFRLATKLPARGHSNISAKEISSGRCSISYPAPGPVCLAPHQRRKVSPARVHWPRNVERSPGLVAEHGPPALQRPAVELE